MTINFEPVANRRQLSDDFVKNKKNNDDEVSVYMFGEFQYITDPAQMICSGLRGNLELFWLANKIWV